MSDIFSIFLPAGIENSIATTLEFVGELVLLIASAFVALGQNGASRSSSRVRRSPGVAILT
jgi:hypothetical protein